MDVRKTKSPRYQMNPNKLAWHFSLVGQEDVCLQSNICLISNEVAERERKSLGLKNKSHCKINKENSFPFAKR